MTHFRNGKTLVSENLWCNKGWEVEEGGWGQLKWRIQAEADPGTFGDQEAAQCVGEQDG